MSAKDIITGQVFPIIGGVLATVMYASPVKATYMARKNGALGDLNPFPFAVALVCTATWVAYGFAARDYNMFLANIPGFTATLYTTVTSHALANGKTQNMMMAMLLVSAPIILVMGVLSAWVTTGNQAQLMWGFTCNAVTIAYYGAPLSTILQVIRSRNSNSIYLPMCICNLINTLLWIGYGFAVLDPFIYVPNGIGCVFAIVLCSLCVIYRKVAVDQSLPEKRVRHVSEQVEVDVNKEKVEVKKSILACLKLDTGSSAVCNLAAETVLSGADVLAAGIGAPGWWIAAATGKLVCTAAKFTVQCHAYCQERRDARSRRDSEASHAGSSFPDGAAGCQVQVQHPLMCNNVMQLHAVQRRIGGGGGGVTREVVSCNKIAQDTS